MTAEEIMMTKEQKKEEITKKFNKTLDLVQEDKDIDDLLVLFKQLYIAVKVQVEVEKETGVKIDR